MKFKKNEFWYVLYMVFIIFTLTISVAVIEIVKVGGFNGDIHDISEKIKFQEDIISQDDYFYLLFSVLKGSGMNLEAQRKDLSQLDVVGAYSISTNLQMQSAVIKSCLNINHASSYTRIFVNCDELDSVGGLPSKQEFEKMNDARGKLRTSYSNLKITKVGLESKHTTWSGFRNLLYVLLIALSGIGTAFKYFLDKTH